MKKPKNDSSSERMAVLAIASVTASSGSNTPFDSAAKNVLQEAGFQSFRQVNGTKIAAEAPPHPENGAFLFEYDPSAPTGTRFKIFRVFHDGLLLVDSGFTLYVGNPVGERNQVEVECHGDILTDWTLNCVPADPAFVNKLSQLRIVGQKTELRRSHGGTKVMVVSATPETSTGSAARTEDNDDSTDSGQVEAAG